LALDNPELTVARDQFRVLFFRQRCGKSVGQTDFEPRFKIGSAVGQDPVGDMELNWRCHQFAGNGLPRRFSILASHNVLDFGVVDLAHMRGLITPSGFCENLLDLFCARFVTQQF
jgi:hypothetical protein